MFSGYLAPLEEDWKGGKYPTNGIQTTKTPSNFTITHTHAHTHTQTPTYDQFTQLLYGHHQLLYFAHYIQFLSLVLSNYCMACYSNAVYTILRYRQHIIIAVPLLGKISVLQSKSIKPLILLAFLLISLHTFSIPQRPNLFIRYILNKFGKKNQKQHRYPNRTVTILSNVHI